MDRYEEALERAKKGLPIDEVFPELKESEDEKNERIRKFIVETIFRQYGDSQEYLEVLAYLEKQKKQKPAESAALQKAFISSKTDYTLKEKCDASDYADAILPTSVADGENEEEYKLHKIIEAAFIAGQKKEQKPAGWSEDDKGILLSIKCVIDEIWHSKNNTTDCPNDELEEMWRWLNTLYERVEFPQPHWKPSEEQMEALEWMLTTVSMKDGGKGVVLKNLINDLKKL